MKAFPQSWRLDSDADSDESIDHGIWLKTPPKRSWTNATERYTTGQKGSQGKRLPWQNSAKTVTSPPKKLPRNQLALKKICPTPFCLANKDFYSMKRDRSANKELKVEENLCNFTMSICSYHVLATSEARLCLV